MANNKKIGISEASMIVSGISVGLCIVTLILFVRSTQENRVYNEQIREDIRDLTRQIDGFTDSAINLVRFSAQSPTFFDTTHMSQEEREALMDDIQRQLSEIRENGDRIKDSFRMNEIAVDGVGGALEQNVGDGSNRSEPGDESDRYDPS